MLISDGREITYVEDGSLVYGTRVNSSVREGMYGEIQVQPHIQNSLKFVHIVHIA